MKEKATKTPFPVQDKVAPAIHGTGLQREFGISLIPGSGVADGVAGDLIVISPAYNITETDVELIVERAAKAIEHVLGTGISAKM